MAARPNWHRRIAANRLDEAHLDLTARQYVGVGVCAMGVTIAGLVATPTVCGADPACWQVGGDLATSSLFDGPARTNVMPLNGGSVAVSGGTIVSTTPIILTVDGLTVET